MLRPTLPTTILSLDIDSIVVINPQFAQQSMRIEQMKELSWPGMP